MIFGKKKVVYDNECLHHLTENGERVYLDLEKKIPFKHFDMYQKSHFKRYKFAASLLRSQCIGDFACGTGYGTVMLAQNNKKVIGVDIKDNVVREINRKYTHISNVNFINKNLLELDYKNYFDTIVSFETIEHLGEDDILIVLRKFSDALKTDGMLIFSVPYLQEKSPQAIKMGFHKTFEIDELRIHKWFKSIPITINKFFYQNYKSHHVRKHLRKKDFIICVGKKKIEKDD